MSNSTENLTVGFLGAGKMAQALCKGFITAGLIKAENVIASATRPAPNLTVFQEMGCKVTTDNASVVPNCKVLFLAVKPHILPGVMKVVGSQISPNQLVISVVAGTTLEQLQAMCPKQSKVIRSMPNTPSLVQCGVTGYTAGEHVKEEDCGLFERLMGSVGLIEKLPERLIDSVVGVAGSGVAYMFLAIEALSDGGVKMGLPRDVATKLAAHTLMGAGKMVLETGQHPGQLKDGVTSPGGCTIEAIHELEKSGFRGSLMNAVESATMKARLLGQPSNK